MTNFHVIIPARYGSSRLPGKPLVDIAGKPMIQHVVEVARASGAKTVTVATDDNRILEVVANFGGAAVMTKDNHASGTDRITEASEILGLADDDIVVNLQGDEPLMPAELLFQVATALQDTPTTAMATLCTPLEGASQLTDPATVKVITNQQGLALYFSRAPIPWVRQNDNSNLTADAYSAAQRHLGIYAYTSGYLKQFAKRFACPLEQYERLEQLRVLWHGESIICPIAEVVPPAGVDNEEDLQRVRDQLSV